MSKPKYCIVGKCDKEAVLWKGKLLKSRDTLWPAAFCADHKDTPCPNMFGMPNVYGFLTKDMVLVPNEYQPKNIASQINVIEQ